MRDATPNDTAIAKRIEELLSKRASNASICPSEVARSLTTDEAAWRALMPQVREVADDMAARGQLVVTQRAQVVLAKTAKGAIRLAKPARPPER